MSGKTSLWLYLSKSKFDGSGRNNFAGAADIYNYMSSDYHMSIFWTFLDYKTYNNKQMVADRVKLAIIVLNIYNFFVK